MCDLIKNKNIESVRTDKIKSKLDYEKLSFTQNIIA